MADVCITFNIDEEIKKRLEILSDKNYRSMSAQIRLIIERFFEEKE